MTANSHVTIHPVTCPATPQVSVHRTRPTVGVLDGVLSPSTSRESEHDSTLPRNPAKINRTELRGTVPLAGAHDSDFSLVTSRGLLASSMIRIHRNPLPSGNPAASPGVIPRSWWGRTGLRWTRNPSARTWAAGCLTNARILLVRSFSESWNRPLAEFFSSSKLSYRFPVGRGPGRADQPLAASTLRPRATPREEPP